MRLIGSIALAACLAAATGTLEAQQTGAPHPGRRMPFERLLERRAELGLSAEQVSRLEGIRDRLQAQNQPLIQQIQAARREAGLPERGGARGGERPRLTDEQRRAARAMRDRVRPLGRQLRDNARAAMLEAQQVLTDAQREQLRRIRAENGERREHRRRPDARRARPNRA